MPTLTLTPHACSDSFYSIGGEAPQSMALLQNLVPAPDDADEWISRPAATLYPGSAAFTPGFVSAQVVIGSRLYGMVSSALNAGKDQPFCYDLLGGAYLTITGITAGNTPTSPVTTGDWQPPHMELIGTKIIVTHSGFDGTGSNFFGVIETANPSALTWTSANTAPFALPSVPVWVSQFYQRAYFFCNPPNTNPATIASEVLTPLSVLDASKTLTYGDNIPLLCGGTLALDNQLGGQIQALIVFKAYAINMFQVTGDFADGTTALNALNIATGTLAPNSVTNTPKGLTFVAPDGLRLIGFDAHVSDPVGDAGEGILIPFLSSVIPSRICSACNATTIRISTQNGALLGTPQQDWCFNIPRSVWFGPHTFPISLISTFGTSFVISPIGITGLWKSDIIPNGASTYVENGASYTCTYQSAFLPDRGQMEQLSSSRAVFYHAFGSGDTVYNVSAMDQNGNILAFTTIPFSGSTTLWDSFTWGSSIWFGSTAAMAAVNVAWPNPIVFDRTAIQISFQAAAGTRLGKFLLEVEPSGYTVLP